MGGSAARVRLLGGFEIVLPDGRTAGPWERPAARRLVQLLLVSPGRRRGREEIIESLFPEARFDRAGNEVSKAISMARAATAPFPVIAADRSSVWIADELDVVVDVDVHVSALQNALAGASGAERAVALEEALATEGRLLDEELYADWTAEPRAALEALRDRAYLELARQVGGIDAWTAVWTRDAGNEEACLALMEAYAASGLRDWVRRTHARTSNVLRDDLGVEPSRAFAARAEAMLAGTAAAPTGATSFVVGRDQFVDTLEASLARETSEPRVVLLTGPAGIGKTTLLDELARRASAGGCHVLRGTSMRGDARAPYAALSAALRNADIPPEHDLLLAALGGAPMHVERHGDRDALATQLGNALTALGERQPILLVLDDMQWSDTGLRDVVWHLAANPAPGRWSVAMAGRTDDSQWTLDLPRRVDRHEVAPLADDAVLALLDQRVLQPSDPNHVVALSGGNPLFAIELAKADAEPSTKTQLPPSILDLFDDQLAVCSPSARQLASVVVLLGADATLDILSRVGAADAIVGSPEAVIRSLDELLARGLIVESERAVQLSHPLLVEAVLARLNPVRRAHIHSLVADALQVAGHEDVVARHRLAAFESGGLSELAAPAVRAGVAAGRRARAVFADDAAADLLAGALRAYEAVPAALQPDVRWLAVEAWAELGDARQDGCDAEGAAEAYHAGLALAMDDGERVRLFSALGGMAYRNGDLVQAASTYRRGLDTTSQEVSPARARLESDLGWTSYRLEQFDDAEGALRRAAAVLESEGETIEAARAFDRLAVTLAHMDRPDEALVEWNRAYGLAQRTADQRLVRLLHAHAGRILNLAGRPDEALVEIEMAKRQGIDDDLYFESLLHWFRADAFDLLGRTEAALAEREQELALLETVGNARNAAAAEAHRSRLLARLGRHADAGAAAASARSIADSCEDAAIRDLVETTLDRGRTRREGFGKS